MTVLAIEIVNVDEDVAEKVARQAIDLISTIAKVKIKTLVTQPHDDYRGAWTQVDIDMPNDANKSYRTSLVSSLKGLLETQLYLNNKASVYVSLRENDERNK